MLDPIEHVDFVTKRTGQILAATMLRRPHDVLCARSDVPARGECLKIFKLDP